ncbi:MAG: hypothetical protein ABSB74_10075 [Tepidisphaeraceae bacterium]
MSIVATLQTDEAVSKTSALKSYAAILHREAKNKSAKDDEAALRSAMSALGISGGDAARDLSIIKQAVRAEADLVSDVELQRMADAIEVARIAGAKLQREYAPKLKAAQLALENAQHVKNLAESRIAAARDKLFRLQQQSPRAFGEAPPPIAEKPPQFDRGSWRANARPSV